MNTYAFACSLCVFVVSLLLSGKYLPGVCAHPSWLITHDASGTKISGQNFESGIANVHGQFRQIYLTILLS